MNSRKQHARPNREYLGENKDDFFQKITATCTGCQRRFESKQLIWSGKQLISAPKFCPRCEVIASLTPMKLPSKRSKREPEFTTEQKMSPQEFDSLLAGINECLTKLHILADNGDQRAINLLIHLAANSTMCLQRIARRAPELLRPNARQSVSWPSFIGSKTVIGELNDWLVKELQVGAEVRGKYNLNAPSTLFAVCMMEWLRRHEADLGLPRLSPSTINEWFEKGWDSLLFHTRGQPEEEELLKPLTKAALSKRGSSLQSIKRDGVKVAVRQSFKSYGKSLFHIV